MDHINGLYGDIYHTSYNHHARQGPTHFLSTLIPSKYAVYDGVKEGGKKRVVPIVKRVYDRTKCGVDLATQFLHRIDLYRREKKWPLRVVMMILGLSVFDCMLINKQNGLAEGVTWDDYAVNLGIDLCGYEGAS